MWQKPVCSSDESMRASPPMKQAYFQCGTVRSAANLDSYQGLENLLARADAIRLKPAARLRRFRRVVDSVLRRFTAAFVVEEKENEIERGWMALNMQA
jgi:hypothetical protein